MTPHLRTFAFALLVAGGLSARPVHALPPGFGVETMLSGLSMPTALRFAPDGRLFYTELQTGRIRVLDEPGAVPRTWTTLPVYTEGERGLLGLVIHPDFPDSPYVYTFHTNPSPFQNQVLRHEEQGGEWVSSTLLFTLGANAMWHHGGRLAFGPDGMLYVSYGDQTELDLADDPADLRGKIFRLGRGGRPAPGNPYGPTNPAALIAVRNVFGLTFDPLYGTGYFTENGESCDDEVHLLSLGRDYGWGSDDFCGTQPAGTEIPLLRFTPTIAPTGCVVYRGTGYAKHLDGNLFFGAFNDGTIRRVRFQANSVTTIDTSEVFHTDGLGVLDVTVGPDGFLWYSTTSAIKRITSVYTVGVGERTPATALRAWPNPFARAIAFAWTDGTRPDAIEILDVTGRRVRSLDVRRAEVVWDGRDDAGTAAAPGVYFTRVTRGTDVAVRRIVRLAR